MKTQPPLFDNAVNFTCLSNSHSFLKYFILVPGLSTAKGLSFAFQTNDPHTNEFKLAILRLHENNFLSSLERKWWQDANKCPEEEETSKLLYYFSMYYIL